MGFVDIAITRTLDRDFDEVVEAVTKSLADVGFGILTTIDLQAKMKEKLDRDMGRYLILGACNPPLAWDAVGVVPQIGVLLPCNVVVREVGDRVVVDAMNPLAALSLIDDPTVTKVAAEAATRLEKALDAL